MTDSVDRVDGDTHRSKGVVKHALGLFGVAALIYGTYIVYVFAFTLNN